MANVSRVNGFKPVKHFSGAPYNGQCNAYEVSVSETVPVFVGDLVVRSTNASTIGSIIITSSVNSISGIISGGAASGVIIELN